MKKAAEWVCLADGMREFVDTLDFPVDICDEPDGSISINVGSATQPQRFRIVVVAYHLAHFYGKVVLETVDTIGFVSRPTIGS